jgi:putative phosphoribosyl transferase
MRSPACGRPRCSSLDTQVLELNREALDQLETEKKLEVVPGATHLFEEPGALERVAELASWWLVEHLAGTERAWTDQGFEPQR